MTSTRTIFRDVAHQSLRTRGPWQHSLSRRCFVHAVAATAGVAITGTGFARAQEASPVSSGSSPEMIVFEGGDRLMGMAAEIVPPATSGGTFIEGETFDIPTMNILQMNTSWYQQLVFEQLTEVNPYTGEPVGLLAEWWETADYQTWIFHLRQGVLWHDGEPFTAEDVKFTYDLHLNPEANSRYHTTLKEWLSAVDVLDELTIQFRANQKRPDFVLAVTNMPLGARHVLGGIAPADLSSAPASTGADPSQVIGTGPFRLQEAVPGDHMTFVKWGEYWDGSPILDEWIYRVLVNSDAAILALQSGEIDYMPTDQASHQEILEAAGFMMHEFPLLAGRYEAIPLNLARPLFREKTVRHALMHALDREQLIVVAGASSGDVMESIYPPGSIWADPALARVHYAYDPERATALLDEAGWLVGADGVRSRDGERMSFTLSADASWAAWVNILTAVQEYWRVIGVEAIAQIDSYEVVKERYLTGDYDAVVWDALTGLWPDYASLLYGTGGADNQTGYSNPEVDALFAAGRTETDEVKRKEIYAVAQALILEDLPILTLHTARSLGALSPRVHNYFPAWENLEWSANLVWVE